MLLGASPRPRRGPRTSSRSARSRCARPCCPSSGLPAGLARAPARTRRRRSSPPRPSPTGRPRRQPGL
eukprot:7246256-Pyramimonas_sp.AAC.1